MILIMSSTDSNSAICTDIVNKEHYKLCLSEYFGPMNLMITTVVRTYIMANMYAYISLLLFR